MSGRLPSDMLVGALLRRTSEAGGFGMILAKGDAGGGAILVVALARQGPARLFERGVGPDGRTALIESTPADDLDSYLSRRRSRDPDLWVVELDTPSAERFAAETIASD